MIKGDTISVIIPTRQRRNKFEKFVKSLYQNCNDTNHVELVVSIDEDDESYKGVDFLFDNVILILSKQGNLGYITRNAIEGSSGDIIFLCNDDVSVMTPDWDVIFRCQHNMYYDKTMIMEECHRNNYSKKMNFNRNKKGNYIPEYCTMKHGTNLCKIEKYNQKNNTTYFKYPKLEELYRHLFNEDPTGMHNAFVDILLTIKCYLKMTRDVESNEINKLLLHFNQAY